MSSRCSTSTCLNGNCQGCRNGSQYCNDPRCYPDCPGCEGITEKKCVNKRDGTEWGLIIAITVLSLIVLGLMLWGYFSYRRQIKANETSEVEDTSGRTLFQSIDPNATSSDQTPMTDRFDTRNQMYESTQGLGPSQDFSGPSQGFGGEVLPRVPRADLRFPENITVSTAEDLSVRPSVIDSTIRGNF